MTLIVKDGCEVIVDKRIYSAMRGAFVWPYEQTPGYCCIFGVTKDKNKYGSSVYAQVAEVRAYDLTEFLETIIDLAEKYYCDTFYAPTTKEYRLQKKKFYSACKNRNPKLVISNSSRLPPCLTVIPQIVDLSHDEVLELILDSEIDVAMHSVTVEDFDNNMYPEVVSLCNIVSSFELFPPQFGKKKSKSKRTGTGYS